MKTYLFTYCLGILFAIGLTPVVITWARCLNLVDKPHPRKIHKRPVARVGGIAIFASTMLAFIPVLLLGNQIGERFRELRLEIFSLWLASSLVFLCGLYDDLKQIRIRTKLTVQFFAAVMVCASGIYISKIVIRDLVTIELGWLGFPITIIWIIGVTNAVNLIDGLDGLAAGISALACAVISILAILQGNVVLAVIMLASLGALMGFLVFNFYPAQIFMGDCGSLYLGFLIASSSVLTAAKSEALVGIGLPIIVLGIPIFDTLLSILRRYLQRRGIMSPDRGHFHHLLIDRGFQQHHVAMMAYGITLFITGIGLLMLVTNRATSVIILLLCMILLLIVFRVIGSVHLTKTLRRIRARMELAHRQRLERKKFEEVQLHFNNVKTLEQWWSCMCRAADALEFSSLCLRMDDNRKAEQVLNWNREKRLDQMLEDILEVKLSIPGKDKQQAGNIEIKVIRNGSLESAGRRIALFTRLADENGLDSVLLDNDTK